MALLLLLSAVIQQVFSFITETLFSLQIDPYELQALDFSNGMVITIVVSTLFSMVVSFFVNIIILLNQGIIFYSLKGEKVFSFGLCFHNKGGIMSIDLRHKFL